MDLELALTLVIDLAHDYSLETRIRRLLEEHLETGDTPRTLVMSSETWQTLVSELSGRSYSQGYFWTPQGNSMSFFRGLPILIKDFIAEGEVIVGV